LVKETDKNADTNDRNPGHCGDRITYGPDRLNNTVFQVVNEEQIKGPSGEQEFEAHQ
jgi:hypothetical protein